MRLKDIRASLVGYPDYAIWFLKKNYELLGILLGIIFSLIFIGIGNWFRHIKFVHKKEYVEVISDTITTVHPLVETNHLLDNSLKALLYRSLVNVKATGEIQPDLLKAFSVRNNYKEYIIQIKDDIYWSNKTRITAKDVVFTYKFIKKFLPNSTLGKTLQGAEIQELDDTHILFKFKTPYVGFIKELTNPIAYAGMYNNKTLTDLLHTPYTLRIVTSGNYILKYLGIDTLKLRLKEKDFWITWKYQRTPQSAYHEFIEKKADAYVMNLLDVNLLKKLQKTPGVIVSPYPISYEIKGIFFNLNNKNSLNVEDRKYILSILQKENFYKDLGYKKAYSIYPENSIFFNKKLKYPKQTISSKNNISLDLSYLDFPEEQRVAEYLKEILSKHGVSVNLRPINIEDFDFKILEEHDFQALLYGIKIGADPDQSVFWHSKGKLNISNLKDTEVDKLLEQALATYNTLEREILYKKLQEKLISEKAVFIPLYHPNLYVAYWEYVEQLGIKTLPVALTEDYNRVLYAYPNAR